MATIAVVGNSPHVEANRIIHELKTLKWAQHTDCIITPSTNRSLMAQLQNVAQELEALYEVEQIHWERRDASGAMVPDRGALFRFYESLIPKVSAILIYSTGQDKAADTLKARCDEAKRTCIRINVETPRVANNIGEAGGERRTQQELQKLKEQLGAPDDHGGPATGDHFDKESKEEPLNINDLKGWE